MLEQVFAKLLLERFWYDIIYRYTYYTPTSFSQAIHSFLLLMIQEFNELPGLVIFETVFLGMYNTHWWVVLFAACHEHGLSGNIPESQVPVPLSEERCEDLRWLGCYWFKRLSFLKTTSAIEIGVWLAILLIGSFKFHCLHSLSLEFW